jgi:hypothetical protein
VQEDWRCPQGAWCGVEALFNIGALKRAHFNMGPLKTALFNVGALKRASFKCAAQMLVANMCSDPCDKTLLMYVIFPYSCVLFTPS